MPENPQGEVNDEDFGRYQQAWSDGDVEGIVTGMTADGLYEASFGPEPWGRRYVGHDEIRAALIEMGVGQPGHANHVYGERFTIGNRGFSEWTSTSTAEDGTTSTVHGADFYEFRDGLVSKKIAYRKGGA
ncbi:nuclear transport factor 2 family protein [Occultella glacieicola]|uniref:Nuclear transport factor 2 family protein n=1 Tax=Occultella glacieicola TaxID=2518684 RepID=A0ABY2DY85_9MICO|nr:nuclear transport factor 2 family protein [Occultella glacieicola]TDE88559.1 nuclear transport factor 2 family protein [Occultella glacieicola]